MISLGGASLIGAGASFLGGMQRNQAAQAQSAKQMAFQREMSNTAHQRQVKDLRAAGLNPILSAKYGGSSSPGGAQAVMQDVATPAVNTGVQALKSYAESEKIQMELKPLLNQVGTVQADSWLKKAQQYLAERDTHNKEIAKDILLEELKIKKKQALISEFKYNALVEGLTTITNEFEGLNFLTPSN